MTITITSPTSNAVVRLMRVTTLVAAMVATTCGAEKPPPASPPPVAAAPSSTSPGADSTTTTTIRSTTATTVSPGGKPADAAREACESMVHALSADKQKQAAANAPEARQLARQAPEFVICRAIAADSDAPCKMLDAAAATSCLELQSTFHELRAYPNGRSFMFNAVQVEECRKNKDLAAICDPFLQAARTGDPNKCMAGPYGSICRAIISLDKSLCAAEGPNADVLQQECRKQIDAKQIYAKGLKDLAESGPARERGLAKAALGEPGACDSYTQQMVDACLAHRAQASATQPAAPAAPKPGGAPPSQHPPAHREG